MSDNGPCNCEQAIQLNVEVERLKDDYFRAQEGIISARQDAEVWMNEQKNTAAQRDQWNARAEAAEAAAELLQDVLQEEKWEHDFTIDRAEIAEGEMKIAGRLNIATLKRAETAEALNKEIVEVLRKLEYLEEKLGKFCPWCGKAEGGPHAHGCELDELLARIDQKGGSDDTR